MTAAFIASASELERVPDGTVISWLRIPGDSTSEAVAFVRREVETDHDDETETPVTREVVWISPGGWAPHTIESAGVTFPATVIRWGEVTVSEAPADALQSYVLDSGGQYARASALDAAVRLFGGDSLYVLPRNGEGPKIEVVLAVAKRFEEHLLRDDLADALTNLVEGGLIDRDDINPATGAPWLHPRTMAGEVPEFDE